MNYAFLRNIFELKLLCAQLSPHRSLLESAKVLKKNKSLLSLLPTTTNLKSESYPVQKPRRYRLSVRLLYVQLKLTIKAMKGQTRNRHLGRLYAKLCSIAIIY